MYYKQLSSIQYTFWLDDILQISVSPLLGEYKGI